jgi:ABC-type Mn2+/Zn2+ transport system ATPase subunit
VETSAFLLRAVDLVAGHGRKTVLEGVNLAIRPGEFWFFLGTNAQGKSTLLNTMLGVLPRLGGTVETGAGLERSDIGYVPQRCDLAPNLPTTAQEFVSLGLVGVRVPRAERDVRVRDALQTVGLGGLEKKSYWSMSGGQRQRVLVARALARRPRLLCVDEPMNNLDLVTERSLLQLFARQNRDEGLTVVFVTHDVSVAAHFATHVALVHGSTVDVGPRPQLLRPDLLERAYGAPVTIVPLVGMEPARPAPIGATG